MINCIIKKKMVPGAGYFFTGGEIVLNGNTWFQLFGLEFVGDKVYLTNNNEAIEAAKFFSLCDIVCIGYDITSLPLLFSNFKLKFTMDHFLNNEMADDFYQMLQRKRDILK